MKPGELLTEGSLDLDRVTLLPIKTDRLPIVDQVLDVARMFPPNCEAQLECLELAKHILQCCATTVMVAPTPN